MDGPDDTVTAAIGEAFPGRSVDAVSDSGPSWNDANRTVRVDFADGDAAFVKVATDGTDARIATELAAIEYVDRHCEVAVPTVLASGTAGTTPYLATAPMDGANVHRPWADWSTAEREREIDRVGAALAVVHAREFDRHGQIVGGGAEGLTVETASWTETLVTEIERKRRLASTDRYDHYFDAVIEAVRANAATLDCAPATLVHGDPAMPNVFRTDDAIGFIDWELAHVGDPARERYRVEDRLRDWGDDAATERLLDAFRDGYRRRGGSLPSGHGERAPVYDAVRLLGTAGFFDKHAEHVDESPAEAAERLEGEIEAHLDAIR
ncbi:aminoglycoside phosphotransferase [Halosimplex carlsbadense 2-9-1]|uniref:Aminoglycoside phosphotransferase n=1 Tax=Halosimplex carlsbadense 2-9-1 TaxID=797114 RepID=M0D0J8_9EURY|nr:aminoglycoside phosphotransferase family protein [Halosimplex carlsbadense]ELZ28212.1 aminoglycoside phosphotransferase [Halosimplex carlsbadense 2-9-1]